MKKEGITDQETENEPELQDEEHSESVEKHDNSYLTSFEQEMVTIFYKSQDSFEKQLSFISAGALVLSVGFVKDIVHPISETKLKMLLSIGWILLVVTLLLNLISHMFAARYANKALTEIRETKYEPKKILQRNRIILCINWTTIGTMIIGIAFIIIYITLNLLK